MEGEDRVEPVEHVEPVKAMGFHRLPAVQTVQPRLPEAPPNDVGAKGGTKKENPESSVPFDAAAMTSEMSPTFRFFMEKLAHQHLVELSGNTAIGVGSVGTASLARGLASPKVYGSKVSSGKMSPDNSGQEGSQLGSPASLPEELQESGRRKRRISQLMCQQHKNATKVKASRIMQTFEDLGPIEQSVELAAEAPKKETALVKLQVFLQSSFYEMLVAGLLCVYVLWLGVELQIFGAKSGYELGVLEGTLIPTASLAYWDSVVFPAVDLMFTVVFTADVVVRMAVLGRAFWKIALNYIDVLVTLAAFAELVFFWAFRTEMGVNPMLFRLLRIGKLARAIRMVAMNSVLQSLQILTRCLASSTTMLFWTFLLLTFFQCVAGLVASTLCRDFIEDTTQDVKVREDVYRYYGTFTRTFLTMFEILFANWSPPCRVLVDNISEWFSLFFLVYRCILGFAVLNVVNSVFVQQTMRIATSDEQLAFKKKEQELASYTRKVKNLFATMDQSGDGVINFEEFSKLVQSPMLQFLLSQCLGTAKQKSSRVLGK
ncbi:unnamed protein product [Cladocopium goreaui]|uniref:Cation channel sperm-associated protein 1 (CatSper1) n=1 Tax=Cladocopium goreaui TaxID=2562237 RepID=A0A9P1G348_9DINO|nr:unnamed protein product [Cladocopium goreaui]